MSKRIAAGVLALLMVLSIIPFRSSAVEFADYDVYLEGNLYSLNDRVWLQGANAVPQDGDLEDPANCEWDSVKNGGARVSVEGCGKEEHRHTEENGCYDGSELICTKPTHTHSLVCRIRDAYYLWEVVEKKVETPEPTDPSEPSEPGADPEVDAYALRVRNIAKDQNGMPMTGAEFVLLAPPEEEGGNWLVQNSEEDFPVVGEEGYAYFMGTGKDTREGEAIWHLAQNSSAFVTNGKYYNLYQSSDDQWDVRVMVHSDGTYTLLDVTECYCCTCTGDCTAPGHQCEPGCKCKERETITSENGEVEGFDPETNTVTFVNQPVLVNLYIDVETANLPAGITELQVNIYGPGEEDVEQVTITGSGTYWQFKKTGLKPGTYSIEVLTPDCDPIYKVIRSGQGEQEQETNMVELGYGNSNGFFTISFPKVETPEDPTDETTEPTEKPTEPEEEFISNTIVINTVSDQGAALTGAKYGLFSGNTLVGGKTYSQVIDDLEQYVVPGQTVTYTLRQQSAPAGYQISQDNDRYQVRIYENDEGETEVRLKDTKLFSNSIEIGEDGEQIISFRNVLIPEPEEPEEGGTTTVQLTCNVEVDVDGGCMSDTAAIKEMKSRKHSFIVEWEDGKSEPLKLTDGETGTIEVPISQSTPYTVKAESNTNDYTLVIRLGGKVVASNQKLSGDTHLTATASYVIVPGEENVDLYMVKVNGRTKETLAGAKFTLKDEDAEILETYKTKKDGEIEIIDLLDQVGSYTLKENKAPDEYQKLSGSIKINVSVGYTRSMKNGKPVLMQGLVANVSHKNVEKQADGTYLIKNTHESDIPQTGDGFQMGLWAGAMVLSTLGLGIMILDRKRKGATR